MRRIVLVMVVQIFELPSRPAVHVESFDLSVIPSSASPSSQIVRPLPPPNCQWCIVIVKIGVPSIIFLQITDERNSLLCVVWVNRQRIAILAGYIHHCLGMGVCVEI